MPAGVISLECWWYCHSKVVDSRGSQARCKLGAPVPMWAENPYNLTAGARELDDGVLIAKGDDDRVVLGIVKDRVGVAPVPPSKDRVSRVAYS